MATHSIERTSPKGPGQGFVGTCVLCGTPNLSASDALADCPNQRGLTQDAALIEAIKGSSRETPMERSTGNIKYLREEDCEDNDEGA